MSEYKTRTFNIDGKEMRFDREVFQIVFKTYAKEHNMKLGALEELTAGKLDVTIDAVRNWRKGVNGPGSEEDIHKLENLLELREGRLLKDINGGKEMTKLSDRQIVATKKVYDVLVEFLSEFLNTDGFNTTCMSFRDAGESDPVQATYDYIEKLLNKIYLVIEQEYFDLQGTELYNDLNEFAYDDLVNTYNGKVSLTYRVAASMENEGEKTFDDYCDAMARLNSILEKYL